MTGYGRGTARLDGRELTVELKAVNHRFLDVVYRVPRDLPFIEDKLREAVSLSDLKRGRVEVVLTYKNEREDTRAVTIDKAILKALGEALYEARDELEPYKRLTAAEAIELSGALKITANDEDESAVAALAREAFALAACELDKMRVREGEHLACDLIKNLAAVDELRGAIAERAPELPEEYRKRLLARLDEWLPEPVEPQRLAQEVAFMADRAAIDEELSRISSHIAQFEHIVKDEPEAGRKLDFLIQEMNREFNTVGSKSPDARIAQQVVEAKSIIEKLREQVQNAV